MNRKVKLGLGLSILALGAVALSGCTASFCSAIDKSNMLYAYDDGITKYYSAENKPENAVQHEFFTNVYYVVSLKDNANEGLNKILTTCSDSNIEQPAEEYWATVDGLLLEEVTVKASLSSESTAEQVNNALNQWGYIKFYSDQSDPTLWDKWDEYNDKATQKIADLNKTPTSDFVKTYKNAMNSYINSHRSCITTVDGQYGNYGAADETKRTVQIESKSYGYAWSKGFFEGLLVWPIAAFVDILCNTFASAGTGLNGTVGWAQVLAILIVTLIVRTFMFFVSYRSTISNAKMSELQPQIAKIQNKYPNANTNQNEKMRMSQEMQALYKKNGIKPMASLVVLIFQFPIFICVWGALTGSAWLSTGSFLNLNLSDSISSVLFNSTNWGNGSAVTALILFLLMAASQVVSMLLPQWIQKRKQKNVAKLGKNPSQNSQNNRMKIVTYVMMAMIIIMGFSLPSAMGIYWFFGALFSIAQNLVTQYIISKKTSKEKRK